MSKTKGTDVMALRGLVQEKGPAAENALSELLGPRLEKIYKHILATSWTEIDDQAAIYQAAAQVLFPGCDDCLTKLGAALAEKSYSGIYKIFFRLPTVEYIFSRGALIWNTYYERGEASIEPISEKCFEMVVRNFPELPRSMREVAIGHYTVILKLTGAKNIRIDMNESDPLAWRWRASWE